MDKKLKNLYKVPGTLIYTGDNKWSENEISYINYNKDEFNFEKIDDIKSVIIEKDKVNWIIVRGIGNEEVIKNIGEYFDIHNMVLEDVVDYSEDCKVEFFDDIEFFSLNMLNIYENKDQIISEKVSIIKRGNLIISFHESSNILVSRLIERLEKKIGYVRNMKSNYLVFAIIDLLIDSYFLEFSNLEERISKFENLLLDKGEDKSLLKKIFNLKKQVSDLKRFILQLTEMTKSMNTHKIDTKIKIFYEDLYDKSTKLYSMVEGFREDVSTLIELKFSLSNDSMNQVMKTLTIISTIFIPLSFLAGFYGMNFQYMPELNFRYSYPILIGVMIIVVIFMLRYFKNKKWF